VKGEMLHYSNHHYVWVFLKQKIKPSLVSKKLLKTSVTAAHAGCTVLLLVLLMVSGRYILFSFRQLAQV